jgi:alanine racemase
MIRKRIKKLISSVSKNTYKTLNTIEISKSRLIHNFNHIQKQNPGFSLIPVLKANAYGHGLIQVGEVLNDVDCDLIAVDGYFEASKLIGITKHRILVLGYILHENYPLIDTKRCSFVIQDSKSLKSIASINKPVKVHLELNTGMNRLGINPDELNDYLNTLNKYPNLQLEGVMSHLADADNEIDDKFTDNQVEIFDKAVGDILQAGFKPKYIHIAQSAGSVKAMSRYATALRLGIALYGINPLDNKDKKFNELNNLLPVLTLKSTIIKTEILKSGDRVSYNGIYEAKGSKRIATLPLGYYEGVPRQLSNSGSFISLSGIELPILGRVCMNHTMIDIDNESELKVGDQVIVVSNDKNDINSIANISKIDGLFSYSLMTGLSESTRRIITD